jgi:hypothetical protein
VAEGPQGLGHLDGADGRLQGEGFEEEAEEERVAEEEVGLAA